MALTRQERLSIHKKQERLQVRSGVPHVRDLREGVPVLRSTQEGLVEYIRYNGVLYKKVFSRSGDDNLKVKGTFAANNKKPLEAPDWTVTNKTGTPRDLDANGALAALGDRLAQLVDDLISIGLLQ